MLARARSIRPIGQLWCFGLNIRYGINNHISETMANVLAEILMANVWNLKTNLKIWNESMREGEVRVLLNTLNSSYNYIRGSRFNPFFCYSDFIVGSLLQKKIENMIN